MNLSDINPRSDPVLLGAVAVGDVVDDGGPVDCEVLAMALELWRLTGTLCGVAAGLAAWRPGEPWAAWTAAAWAGWEALRPRVAQGMATLAACALVDACVARHEALVARAERLRRDREREAETMERVLLLLEAPCSTNPS